MKYVLIALGSISFILLIGVLIEIIKLGKTLKKTNQKANNINEKIDTSKQKIDYIKSVKDKTILDELALTYLIIGDSLKDLRRSKKKNPVRSIAQAYKKETKHKSYKALPNKIKQFI